MIDAALALVALFALDVFAKALTLAGWLLAAIPWLLAGWLVLFVLFWAGLIVLGIGASLYAAVTRGKS